MTYYNDNDPKPRLLDLFCGAGGAAMGYHRAGFEVVGVDLKPQKHYPFEFHQADALEFLAEHGREFDVIHASPPCQAHTSLKNLHDKDYPELIEPTRRLLEKTGLPYIIENVVGAPLRNPILLCGSSFGLRVRRHRLFESNWFLIAPPVATNGRRRAKSPRSTTTANGISRGSCRYTGMEAAKPRKSRARPWGSIGWIAKS